MFLPNCYDIDIKYPQGDIKVCSGYLLKELTKGGGGTAKFLNERYLEELYLSLQKILYDVS